VLRVHRHLLVLGVRGVVLIVLLHHVQVVHALLAHGSDEASLVGIVGGAVEGLEARSHEA